MAVIATAEVRIVADTSRFLSNLRKQLRGAFSKMGAQAAKQFTKSFNQNLGNQFSGGLRRAGQQGGQSFTDALRTALRRGLRGIQILGFLNLAIVQGLQGAALLIARGLRVAFVEGGGAIVNAFRSRVINPLRTLLSKVFGATVGRALNQLVPLFQAAGKAATNAFTKGIADPFRGFVRRAASATRAARSAFASFGADVGDAFRDLGDRAAVGFKNIGTALRIAFSNAYDAVSLRTLRFNSQLIRHWTTGAAFVQQEVASIFTRMWRGISDMGVFQIGIIASEWAKQMRNIFTGLPSGLRRSFDEIRSAAQSAARAVAGAFGPVFRRIGTFVSGVGSSFVSTFARVGKRSAAVFGAAWRRLGAPIVASLKKSAPRIRRAVNRAFAPAARSAQRAFNLIPWARIGKRLGRRFGRGAADGAEEELDKRGQKAGAKFGKRLTKGLTLGIKGLSAALAAISLKPLQGLAGILRNATSEMLSMGGQALVVLGLLESLSGVLFALPAAVSVLGAAVATAAVAFKGFGSAIGAAFEDTAAFNEAIQDLAPNAQAVAREFRAIAPALTDLRLDVQNALFAQLGGTITNVANNLLGPLREGMTTAATALGSLVAEVGQFLSEAGTASTVNAVFQTLAGIFDALAQSAQPFLQGMRTLVDEFLPRVAELAGPLASVGDQFRSWTDQVVSSGAAMEAFNLAIDTFSELGSIVADLAGIFQAMFSAAQLAGVDALGAIGEALEVVRTTFESFEGQVALANVFGAIGNAVTALAPVFSTLITQLGLVFPIIGQIAQAIGPSLSVVLEGLGQALLALGPGVLAVFDGIATAAEAIAPALVPLGEALGSILSAIAPLLPVVGELIAVVVELGAQIIGVLAQAITPIAEAISAVLLPILPQLSELFTTLITAVAPLIQVLGEGLASVIQTLLSPILQLVVALADALMPIIQAIVPVLTPLLEIFFQLSNTIGALLVPVLGLLLPIIEALSPIFQLLGVVLAPLLQLLTAILQPVTMLITFIASLLTPAIQFLAEIIGAIISTALTPLSIVFQFLADVIADHVIPWFEKASAVMQLLWVAYIEPLGQKIRDLASTVSDRFDSIRDTISTVVGTIEDVLGGLDDFFGDVFGSIGDAVESASSIVSDAVSNIVGLVQDAINSVQNLGNLDLNPFADGGIVNSPTAALIGEAGREVVIPLTRPARAAELAQQSGLIDLLAAQGVLSAPAAPAGSPIEMHVHSDVADPEQIARRAVRLIERRQRGRGLERIS